MDPRIPTPTITGRTTTFVLVTSLAAWKRMRRIKGWRALGRGGMVLTVGFEASAATLREMAREVLKTTGWCLVRIDLTATW